MPGGAETVEAWLALPCEPGRAASRGEGPGHGGSSMGVAVELAIEGARAKAAGIPQAAAFLEWVGRPTSEDPSPQCGCEHCQTRATQGCSTDGDTMVRARGASWSGPDHLAYRERRTWRGTDDSPAGWK